MKRAIVRIAVCLNESNWHIGFIEALQKFADQDNYEFELVEIDSHDWIERLEKFDAVIWKPSYMGSEACGYLKEKIYFIETFLNKIVIPNFATIWHFESKAAQSYLFNYFKIQTPLTCATFDLNNALEQIENYSFPIVMKQTYGAGSVNVRLAKNKPSARKILKMSFSRQLIKGCKKLEKFYPWNLPYILKYFFDIKYLNNNQHCGYWQEFIPKNSRDLRVTVIGQRYVFGFWRNNRPNDFRASGGGNIDYESPIPMDALRYCLEINRKLNFDSMAYDLVFAENGDFKVIEMSYGYIDTAIHKTPGHYKLTDDDQLEFRAGHTWPQELWALWLLERLGGATNGTVK